ncbi:MAG TPA: hypothetical protein VGZ72_02935 [Stellaceae bacterium]|jgi:hypothetical protein|nr:hypothetical protein [Stellaceae bacterium]
MKSAERADAPRRTAQSIADDRQKRDDDVKRQIKKERQTLEEKVARLRALRLAKEAADALSAEAAPAPRKPRARRAEG